MSEYPQNDNITITWLGSAIPLSCAHFDDEPRAHKKQPSEGPAVLHICSLSNNSKWQLGAQAQTEQQYFIHGHMVDLLELKSSLRRNKLHRTNYGSNFLGGSFSNRDDTRAPIQLPRDGVSQDYFFIRFYINRIVLLDWSNETS